MTEPGQPLTGTGERLSLGDFRTSRGEVLRDAWLGYRVFGDTAAAARNGWILVFHALTGSPDVDAWWGPLLGPGAPLDTSRHAIIAANLPGSCYGSTGPGRHQRHALPRPHAGGHGAGPRARCSSTSASTGSRWSPAGRSAAWWRSHGARCRRCRSTGWSCSPPRRPPARRPSPGTRAQRMAIEADSRWQGGHFAPGAGPVDGLAAARAIAMITYRSGVEFDERFGRGSTRDRAQLRRGALPAAPGREAGGAVRRAELRGAHGARWTRTTWATSRAPGHGHGERVGEVVGVGIDTDILYYAGEVREWVERVPTRRASTPDTRRSRPRTGTTHS